jgi:hypothetical protein
MRTMDLGVIDEDDWSHLPVVSPGVTVSACRLVAYMYWPDHEVDRNRYLAFLVAKALGAAKAWKAAEETIAGADIGALYAAFTSTTDWLGSQLEGLGGFILFTSGPGLEECTQAMARAARPGNLAGRVLLAARAVHFCFAGSRKSTSINRAVDLVRRVNGYSINEIWDSWAAYKSVAHLFAASILLNANPGANDGGYSVFAGLPCVLKIAQELQDFGLSAIPRGRQTPLLDPGQTWRLPDFPGPEGMTLLEVPSISEEMRCQIDAYRARQRPLSTP